MGFYLFPKLPFLDMIDSLMKFWYSSSIRLFNDFYNIWFIITIHVFLDRENCCRFFSNYTINTTKSHSSLNFNKLIIKRLILKQLVKQHHLRKNAAQRKFIKSVFFRLRVSRGHKIVNI